MNVHIKWCLSIQKQIPVHQGISCQLFIITQFSEIQQVNAGDQWLTSSPLHTFTLKNRGKNSNIIGKKNVAAKETQSDRRNIG